MTENENAPAAIVDLSHTIEDGMITYQGLPAPKISDHLSREDSREHYQGNAEFQIGKIEMVANTGTYLDSPFHRYQQGSDLSKLPISSVVNLDGITVRVPDVNQGSIGKELFEGLYLQHKAVLIHTGWDKYWRLDHYFEGHPYLTRDAAEYLRDNGAALVGIDSLNIDDTQDGFRPVHTVLLESNIPIIEHMTNLDQLPITGFKLFAPAPKIIGLGSFPVRVFALIDK